MQRKGKKESLTFAQRVIREHGITDVSAAIDRGIVADRLREMGLDCTAESVLAGMGFHGSGDGDGDGDGSGDGSG